MQACAVQVVKTCPFWRDHPKMWFNQLEAKFRAHNIRVDDLKFCVVVDNLDKEFMLEIFNVIESSPITEKYLKIKETLILRLTDSDEKRWKNHVSVSSYSPISSSMIVSQLIYLERYVV